MSNVILGLFKGKCPCIMTLPQWAVSPSACSQDHPGNSVSDCEVEWHGALEIRIGLLEH